MPSKITLPAGTPFIECYQSLDNDWKECTHLGELSTKREGEFTRTPDNSQSAASFSAPTVKDCIGPPVDKVSSCDIQLNFSGKQVQQLQEQKLIPFPSTPPPLPPNTNTGPSVLTSQGDPSSPVQNQSSLVAEPTSPFKSTLEFLKDNSLFLFPALIFLFLIILFKDKLKYILFSDDRTKKRPSQDRRLATTAITSPLSVISAASDDSNNISSKFADIAKELKKVNSKLEQLESILLALEQRHVSQPSRPFSGQVGGVVSPPAASMDKPQPAAIPVAPPPLLSIDLVKQAVAQTDYSLISSYSHLFLNETQESRQGKFERRRFDVLGNQLQSSSFANAEFIAISVGSECFLIPNILPNAADPRRTMKRHVDSNSIYRAGAGSNILKIDKLATLQQLSTASYELATLGSIE